MPRSPPQMLGGQEGSHLPPNGIEISEDDGSNNFKPCCQIQDVFPRLFGLISTISYSVPLICSVRGAEEAPEATEGEVEVTIWLAETFRTSDCGILISDIAL